MPPARITSCLKGARGRTWRDARGDGGGGQQALAFGRHAGHFDGVGGERRQPGDPVLQGDVGQVVSDPGVGPVVLLPGDSVA